MIDAIATDQSYLPLKFSRNKLTHTIEAADTALTSRVGLKYYLTLSIPEFEFSDNFEELHTSEGREKPVDDQSGLQIYAGAEFRYNSGRNGKIDGLLNYSKPRRRQDAMSVSLSQTIAYTLTEDVKGGVPEVNTTRKLGKMYAIKAGLQNDDFVAFGDTFFNKWQLGARQFLTWQPNYKRIGKAQEEYLYFLLNFTPKPQTLNLRVQHYDADGYGSDAITAMNLANPLLYSVVCCPVGPEILAIPETAVRYDVWLSNEDNKRVSEIRSYFIDIFSEVFDRSILFVNSLGGWDTLRLNGQAQRTLKVSQMVAELERPADAPVDFSELKIINIEGEYELVVSTGYFKNNAADYLKYLDELLLSEELFLITDKGHKPLQLINTSMVDDYDNADLIARTFSFRILDTIENYSNLPAQEPVPERKTKWLGLGLKHVLDSAGKRTGKLVFSRLQKVFADDNSLVKPYTVKPNSQGDPDYLPPITDSSITVGSTPFPNVAISRAGSFNRANCGANHIGGPATIAIPSGSFGGESAGDADALAEARFNTLNTQQYANTNGTCTLNNVPVKFGIKHMLIAPDGYAGPVVDLRLSMSEIISNTVPSDPIGIRLSDNEYNPGTYNFILEVEYQFNPTLPCKISIPSKNRSLNVLGESGFYMFENVVVNSSDNPLVFEITAI